MRIAYFANYSESSLSGIVFETLKSMGHEVLFFSPNIISSTSEIKYCEALVDVPEVLNRHEFKPELILFMECAVHPLLFPLNLEQASAPSCWWGVDTHLNYPWHKDFIKLFDHAFFALSNFIAHAERYSKKPVHWLPLACNPAVHKDLELSRDLECSFVGTVNASRQKIFQQISKEVPLKIYNGKSQDELTTIYSRSKIGFNISTREDLNKRVFEVMACGAALVTQKIDNGLTQLFKPGENILTHTISDAAEVIGHALKDPERLREIGKAGYAEVQANHTYRHRLQNIIDVAIHGGKREHDAFTLNFAKAQILVHEHYNRPELAKEFYTKAAQINPEKVSMNPLRSVLENIWFKITSLFSSKF